MTDWSRRTKPYSPGTRGCKAGFVTEFGEMCEYIFVEDKEGAADQALNRIVYHGISTWRPFEQPGNTHR
jgi:hypothetical protein